VLPGQVRQSMSQLRTGDNAARRAFVREITNPNDVYERSIINFTLVGISTCRVYYEKTTVVANEFLDNLKFNLNSSNRDRQNLSVAYIKAAGRKRNLQLSKEIA